MGKKKKLGVGIDFKRVKHKVGKKLPKAQNETNTDVKSKAIVLPGQSLQQDKDGVPVNNKNLTLKELLSQMTHHNDKVRKDAVLGLQDLVNRHPSELHRHTRVVLERVCERFTDSDKGTRSAVRYLLQHCLLPALPLTSLQPFLPLLMAHVSSAMTHVRLEVRQDALLVLDLLAESCAPALAHNYLATCTSLYGNLLSEVLKGGSLKAQSLASISKVVASLTSFLQRVVGREDHLRPENGVPDDHQERGPPPVTQSQLLGAYRLSPPAQKPLPALPVIEHFLTVLTSSGPASSGRHPEATGTPAASQSLLEALVNCWTACSPSQAVVPPEGEVLTVLVDLLKSMRLLLTRCGGQQTSATPSSGSGQPNLDREVLVKVAQRVASRFPLASPAARPSLTLQELMVQYNLEGVHVLNLVLSMMAGGGIPRSHQEAVAVAAYWEKVLGYCLGVLQGGPLVPLSDMLGDEGSPTTPSANKQPYVRLVRLVGAMITKLDPHHRLQLLGAISEFARKLGGSSPVYTACLEVQHRCLVQLLRKGPGPTEEQWLVQCVLEVPRKLWELRGKSLPNSYLMLQLLHDALRFSPKGGRLEVAVTDLQSQLLPLLCTEMSKQKKGKRKAAEMDADTAPSQVLVGPLVSHPLSHQLLLVDILVMMPQYEAPLLRTLALMSHTQCCQDEVVLRLLEGVMARAREAASPQLMSVLVASLLVGPERSFINQEGLCVDASPERHLAVATCVCRQAKTYYGKLGPLACQIGSALLSRWSKLLGPNSVAAVIVEGRPGRGSVMLDRLVKQSQGMLTLTRYIGIEQEREAPQSVPDVPEGPEWPAANTESSTSASSWWAMAASALVLTLWTDSTSGSLNQERRSSADVGAHPGHCVHPSADVVEECHQLMALWPQLCSPVLLELKAVSELVNPPTGQDHRGRAEGDQGMGCGHSVVGQVADEGTNTTAQAGAGSGGGLGAGELGRVVPSEGGRGPSSDSTCERAEINRPENVMVAPPGVGPMMTSPYSGGPIGEVDRCGDVGPLPPSYLHLKLVVGFMIRQFLGICRSRALLPWLLGHVPLTRSVLSVILDAVERSGVDVLGEVEALTQVVEDLDHQGGRVPG